MKASRLRPLFLALLFVLCCGAMLVAGVAGPPVVVPLRLICSTSLFRGVAPAEVMASGKYWMEKIGVPYGLKVVPEITLTDSVEEIRRRIDRADVDILISSALEYEAIHRFNLINPVITLSANNEPGGKLHYLLLVAANSPAQKVDDLSGKSILAYAHADPVLTRLWAEQLLRTQNLPGVERFFSSFNLVLKPSAACLPIFFGKADACLVDDSSWNLLRELNPQVGTKLRVLAQSQPLIEALMSIHRDHKEYRPQLLQSMYELGDQVEGRQVLLFFRCRRSVRIEPSDLASVAELRSAFLARASAAEKRQILPGSLSDAGDAVGSR